MSYRFAILSAENVAHGEERDFVVEIHKSLHDNSAGTGTTAFLSNVPAAVDVVERAANALTVSRTAHDGLYHTRHANGVHRIAKFLLGRCEEIARSGDAQSFGSQAANAFTIHGEVGGIGSRSDVVTLFLEFYKRGSGYCFHFRNDEIGLFGFDNLAQFSPVEHTEHVATVSNLHSRRVVVFVARHHFHAIALKFDCHFLA